MLVVFLPFLIPFFYLLYRAPRSSSRPRFRAIPAYDSLKKLMSRAAETGQAVHVSVGTGGVSGLQTADTLAGLNTLEFLADRAANSDIPPLVTITDPTAFPAALDQLRRAYRTAGVSRRIQSRPGALYCAARERQRGPVCGGRDGYFGDMNRSPRM